MSIAPGNIGRITDCTHNAFGDELSPEWLTVHSARRFGYRDHVKRLANITELTGYSIAMENTPDSSYFHAPEELAVFALLSVTVDQLGETHLLVDTAHVDSDRRRYAVDETVITKIVDRMGPELADRLEAELREFVGHNLAEAKETLPRSDPWRPVLTTLFAVGGSRVRALHLNDPESDGLPDVGHESADGLDHVLRYCCEPRLWSCSKPVLRRMPRFARSFTGYATGWNGSASATRTVITPVRLTPLPLSDGEQDVDWFLFVALQPSRRHGRYHSPVESQ